MEKILFKEGDIVKIRISGEKAMILKRKLPPDYNIEEYKVRLKDYSCMEFYDFELELL